MGEAGEEEGLEERESEGGVEEEAEEVREGSVTDAVVGPGAVVVHFGYASRWLVLALFFLHAM